MSESPWKHREPEPGDLNGDLSTIDPEYIERHRSDPDANVRFLLTVEGEDAKRLQRIAAARGQKPTEVVAEVIRDCPAA